VALLSSLLLLLYLNIEDMSRVSEEFAEIAQFQYPITVASGGVPRYRGYDSHNRLHLFKMDAAIV